MKDTGPTFKSLILSDYGVQCLENQIRRAPSGSFTYDYLSSVASISINTVRAIRHRTNPVHRMSLEKLFVALGLSLEDEHFIYVKTTSALLQCSNQECEQQYRLFMTDEASRQPRVILGAMVDVNQFVEPAVIQNNDQLIIDTTARESDAELTLSPLERHGLGKVKPQSLQEVIKELEKFNKRRHLIVLGEAGIGKSILMHRTCLRMLLDGFVPILLQSRKWDKNFTLQDHVMSGDYLKDTGITLEWGKNLWDLVRTGRAPVLIDGLDEASDPLEAMNIVARFANGAGKNTIIVVSCLETAFMRLLTNSARSNCSHDMGLREDQNAFACHSSHPSDFHLIRLSGHLR